jgi:hypothetical protein
VRSLDATSATPWLSRQRLHTRVLRPWLLTVAAPRLRCRVRRIHISVFAILKLDRIVGRYLAINGYSAQSKHPKAAET